MMGSRQSHSRLLILAVHYKTEQAAIFLLDSLNRLSRSDELDTIIIDNASGEGHLSGLRRAVASSPNVELLPLPANRGYFGAAKFALARYLAEGHALPDWIIVSNSDIVIEDQQFLEKLFAIDAASLGVIAPQIVVPALNLNQNPYMKERPRRLKRFTMRLHSHDYFLSVAWDWLSRIKQRLKSKIAPRDPLVVASSNSEQMAIYAPHGSFMIFSRRYFDVGGYLDDQLFLFCEEIAVGEICRNLGLAVIYNPSLAVIHNEHQSVGVGMTRAKFKYHRQSIRHVLSKYLTVQPGWAKMGSQTRNHP